LPLNNLAKYTDCETNLFLDDFSIKIFNKHLKNLRSNRSIKILDLLF